MSRRWYVPYIIFLWGICIGAWLVVLERDVLRAPSFPRHLRVFVDMIGEGGGSRVYDDYGAPPAIRIQTSQKGNQINTFVFSADEKGERMFLCDDGRWRTMTAEEQKTGRPCGAVVWGAGSH